MACGFIWNGEMILRGMAQPLGLGRLLFAGVITLVTIVAWVGFYRLIVHGRELGNEQQRAVKILELALCSAVTMFSWMNLVGSGAAF